MADDAGAEDLVRDLLGDGYALLGTIEHDNGRLATARLIQNIDGVDIVVDLLFASSGIEPEIAEAAEAIEITPGLKLPVATTGHLIALKLLARDDETRPQDLADLLALREVATPLDIETARAGLRLITNRGFNRDRDLMGALDAMMASGG